MSRAASACPRAHRTRIPLAAVTALLVGTLIAGRALGATAKPAEGGLDIASGSTSRDVALLASTDIEASVHRGEEPALVGSATLSVSSDYAADIISVSVASGSDVAGVTVTVAASGCTNAACVADAPVELRVGMRPTPLLHVADGTITPSVGTSAISYVASTSPTAAAGATARYVVVFTIGPDPAAVAPAPPPTADPTPTPDPTADPTPTPTPDPTADPTPTPAPTADPTPTPTPDPTADPTPPIESTPTPEPTPPPDPTPSVQPATDPTSTPDPQGIESPSLARAALTGDPPSG